MAPPTYAPSRETQSNVVAVPKSTTMAGVQKGGAPPQGVDEPVRADLGWTLHADRYGHVAGAGNHQLHAAALGHDGGRVCQGRYH